MARIVSRPSSHNHTPSPRGLSGCRSYICFTSCGSKRRRTRDSSAMAAHDLPKVEVGGSSPLYRSTHSSSGYSYNDLLFSPLIRDGLEGMQGEPRCGGSAHGFDSHSLLKPRRWRRG